MRAVATLIRGQLSIRRKGGLSHKIRNRVPESPNASDEPVDFFDEPVDPCDESVDFVDEFVEGFYESGDLIYEFVDLFTESPAAPL